MAEPNKPITIIDRGKGPQLSNRRITVQHLLGLFKENASDAEIFRWFPQINLEELNLLRQYYLNHTEEVLALELEIKAYSEELRKRYPPPKLSTDGMTTKEARTWMLQRIAERKKTERNGDHDPAG